MPDSALNGCKEEREGGRECENKAVKKSEKERERERET